MKYTIYIEQETYNIFSSDTINKFYIKGGIITKNDVYPFATNKIWKKGQKVYIVNSLIEQISSNIAEEFLGLYQTVEEAEFVKKEILKFYNSNDASLRDLCIIKAPMWDYGILKDIQIDGRIIQ